jgi:hypothetical protein
MKLFPFCGGVGSDPIDCTTVMYTTQFDTARRGSVTFRRPGCDSFVTQRAMQPARRPAR